MCAATTEGITHGSRISTRATGLHPRVFRLSASAVTSPRRNWLAAPTVTHTAVFRKMVCVSGSLKSSRNCWRPTNRIPSLGRRRLNSWRLSQMPDATG